MSDPTVPYELLLERIRSATNAIASFTAAYMDVPSEDTSGEERRTLAEVADLLDEALRRFQ